MHEYARAYDTLVVTLTNDKPAAAPPPSLHAAQIKESDSDVEVPQSFFTSKELETLMEETKPEWVPASEYFIPEEGSAGKIGRGGLFVEEPVTGTRLRRLNNGVCVCRVWICVLWFLGSRLWW